MASVVVAVGQTATLYVAPRCAASSCVLTTLKPLSLSWNHSFTKVKFPKLLAREMALIYAWANAKTFASLAMTLLTLSSKRDSQVYGTVEGDQIVTSPARLDEVHALVQ